MRVAIRDWIRAHRRAAFVAIAVLVLGALLACPLTWLFGAMAYDQLIRHRIPVPDRSAEVEKAILARYERGVTDLRVKQVNDIEVATDFPTNYTYRVWGYRAEYGLKGVPLTIRIKTYEPEDITEGPEDFEIGDFYQGVFPNEFEMTQEQFETVLKAYAAGSGESQLAEIKTAEWMAYDDSTLITFRDGQAYPRRWTLLIYPRRDDLDDFSGEDAGGYVVVFDPASDTATYLGKWEDISLSSY